MTGAPLRVGIVANTIDAEYGVRTGGTLHFVEVAKRMTEWEVTIFVPSFAAADIAALAPFARVVAIPSIRRLTASKLLLFAASLLAWLARARELRACDVLYASSHFLGDTIPAIAMRGRGTLVVVHHIIDGSETRPGSGVWNAIAFATERLSLWLIRTFAGSIAVDNPSVERDLRHLGFRNRSIVSGNAVDVPWSRPESRGAHDVAFVGRLSPTKGVDDLLRAWQSVVEAVPDARLRIVGDGTPAYRATLVELCASLGISGSVSFLGRASDDEKFSVLRSSSVFAFTSKEEGWGIALAEAMACGLACVTYELAAYRDTFTRGRVGVALGDVDAFGEAVRGLLLDDERRTALGAEAESLARSFDWVNVANLEIAEIRSLVKRVRTRN